MASTELVRPRRGRFVGGVCAGLARPFDMSPTAVRALFVPSLVLPALLSVIPAASACTNCADHRQWPTVHGKFRKANGGRSAHYVGTRRSDELLGHHGSDVLSGRGRSDILWGDHDPAGQPTSQQDLIYGGSGDDFIYGSHGRNVIHAG